MSEPNLSDQLKIEREAIEMAVVSYQIHEIQKLMAEAATKSPENPEQYFRNKLSENLQTLKDDRGNHPFTASRAQAFTERYTPVSVLDQQGAGAVLFRDKTDGQHIGAIRGTDMKRNLGADITADVRIGTGSIPYTQTILLDNFFARETAAKGMPVSQLSIDERSMKLERLPDAIGTGNAEGRLKYVAGHSEGGQEAQTIGARYKTNVYTHNSPNASDLSLEAYIKHMDRATGTKSAPVGQNSLHIDTTELSLISGLNGGLTGHKTLNPTFGINTHSSINGLTGAIWLEDMAKENPKITQKEELIALWRLNELDRQATLDIYNNNPGATMEKSIELVALSKGRESVTMAGYGHGEAAYQDALRQMQEANNQAIAEAAKQDTASQHSQQLDQLRQQANTDYNNAPFDYKETRGGDPEGKKVAEQTYREYKDNRYHGANEYTKDHKAIEKDQQYHHYTPPKPYNQSENEKLQGKSWSDASDVLPAVGGAFASANSLEKGSYGETLDGLNRSLSPNLEEMLKAPTTAFTEKQTEVQHTSMYTVPIYSSEPQPQPTAEQLDQMLSLMAQNPVFASLPSEQQTAMLTSFASAAQTATQPTTTGLNDASQQTVQSSMQQPVEQINPTAVTPQTAQPNADSIQLTPKIAKLHEQITQHLTQGQFGNQIAHLSETEQQAAIALATHEATRNLARSVDYVFVNKEGKMCMSFDGDKGFSAETSLQQAQSKEATQLLTASLDLQQNQQQAAAQRLEQSKNQSGPTMTM